MTAGQFNVGHSSSEAALAAVHEAAAAAGASSENPSTFAMLFSTLRYPPSEVAHAANLIFGSHGWAGCSAHRVFAGREVIEHGIVLAVWTMPSLRVGVGLASLSLDSARQAGAGAVAQALEHLPSHEPLRQRAVVLLTDARAAEPCDVVRGAVSEAGVGAVWAGGGCGVYEAGQESVQFAFGAAHTKSALAIILDSPLCFGTGVRHGWSPVGPYTMVTRAEGRIADELDDRPALTVYRELAKADDDSSSRSDFAHFAMTHPLGVPLATGEFIIRDPLFLDDEDRIRFIAGVPKGSLVCVMNGEDEQLLEAARQSASEARKKAGSNLNGALLFDCISRYGLLGEAFEDELEAIHVSLGEAPLAGCLTFGEVGSIDGGIPQFHNKTAVVLAMTGEQ